MAHVYLKLKLYIFYGNLLQYEILDVFRNIFNKVLFAVDLFVVCLFRLRVYGMACVIVWCPLGGTELYKYNVYCHEDSEEYIT